MLAIALVCTSAVAGRASAQAVQEHEPNNSAITATPIRVGESVSARMTMPGDVDDFTVDLVAGITVVVDWTGLPTLFDWDWSVALEDASGTRLVGRGGTTWVATDTTLDRTAHRQIWFTIPQTGPYVVHFYAVPMWYGADPSHISGEYPYQLSLSTFRAGFESEINNTASAANFIALGDTVSGEITHPDTDFFAIDLNAGTNLALRAAVSDVGCNALPLLRLYSPDGTELVRETSSPAGGSFNPKIDYPITSSGRYLVSIDSWGTPGGPEKPCYFLWSGTYTLPPPGPGEPTKMVASNIGSYNSMVSSSAGVVYLATSICSVPDRVYGRNKIVRLEPGGGVTLIADGLTSTGPPAVDRFGNLLQPALRTGASNVVWRITPSGERSVFVEGLKHPCSVAVGPDGDVWVGQDDGPVLRFDPLGNLKDSVPSLPNAEGQMIFSPGGLLYSPGYIIYRLENGQWTRAWGPSHAGMGSILAFDRDGYAYTAQGGYFGYNLRGKILLLDPGGHAIVNPLAWVNNPVAAAFVGKRLLVLHYENGESSYRYDIVELNPDAVRAPGYFPDGLFARLEIDSLRSGAVGVHYQDTLHATLGNPKGPWAIIDGELPKGLTLDSSTGVVAGVPAESGTFAMTFRTPIGDSTGIGRTRITVTAPQVSETDIVNALLGNGTLPQDAAEYVDFLGNKNGKLDVGDLRAYLRARGRLN